MNRITLCDREAITYRKTGALAPKPTFRTWKMADHCESCGTAKGRLHRHPDLHSTICTDARAATEFEKKVTTDLRNKLEFKIMQAIESEAQKIVRESMRYKCKTEEIAKYNHMLGTLNCCQYCHYTRRHPHLAQLVPRHSPSVRKTHE